MSRNLGSIDSFFLIIKQKTASCSQGHAGKQQGWSLREYRVILYNLIWLLHDFSIFIGS